MAISREEEMVVSNLTELEAKVQCRAVLFGGKLKRARDSAWLPTARGRYLAFSAEPGAIPEHPESLHWRRAFVQSV